MDKVERLRVGDWVGRIGLVVSNMTSFGALEIESKPSLRQNRVGGWWV